MNTVDKILIAFMVLLLPIGLLISNQLISESKKSDEVAIDAQKLKTMVDNYSNMQIDSKPKGEIVISSISYASESGVVSVSGDAPTSSAGILMSVTVLPVEPSPSPKTSKNTDDNNLVLGRSVDTYSFEPKKDGSFLIDYEIPEETLVVEMRFEQDEAVETIRFDLEKGEQIY